MNWISDIDEALAARATQGKRLLAIFKGNGSWCPWCNELDGILACSDALDSYLEREGILGAKIGIPSRSEDVAGIRKRFGIPGIPYLVFYAADGRVEGTTEFIDDGDASSYVSWIESVDSSGL